jgi:predicted transposase YbfD/YdcC
LAGRPAAILCGTSAATGTLPAAPAVAVDGTTLRGSGHHGHGQVHLLAVMDHTSRGVLAQTEVDSKTNEITQFRPLLDLTDTVVTADALHTQREHADWLVTAKHAAYLLIVKHNQPALHHQLKALPWPDIPVADHTRDRGHGRVETRRLQVTTVAGLDFPRHPGAAHHPPGPPAPLPALADHDRLRGDQPHRRPRQPHLADYVRGHWGIEALHHIRDVTFAEDASQTRTDNTPRTMASLRNPWPSASCAPTGTATSPPRCAATPATPPQSCPCWASQAVKPNGPHHPAAVAGRHEHLMLSEGRRRGVRRRGQLGAAPNHELR